jgi:hypothetical protein
MILIVVVTFSYLFIYPVFGLTAFSGLWFHMMGRLRVWHRFGIGHMGCTLLDFLKIENLDRILFDLYAQFGDAHIPTTVFELHLFSLQVKCSGLDRWPVLLNV